MEIEEMDDVDIDSGELEEDIDIDADDDVADTDDDADDDADDEGNSDGDDVTDTADEGKPDYETMRKSAYEEGLRQGRLKAFEGKTNHFTGDAITDEIDLHAYEVMLAIEKDGGDPIADYHKYDIKQQRERQSAANEAKSQAAKRQSDISDFALLHKNVSISELFSDESFKRFASGKIGNQKLSQIYDDYLGYNAETDKRIAEKSRLNAAKQKSTPGALSTGKATPNKSVDDLSTSEFEKIKQRALRGELRR